MKTLVEKFDELMSHLNGEENGMAESFKQELVEFYEHTEKLEAVFDKLDLDFEDFEDE